MSDSEKKKLINSIATIRWFLEEQCVEQRTASVVVKEDGSKLYTDWGYFLKSKTHRLLSPQDLNHAEPR